MSAGNPQNTNRLLAAVFPLAIYILIVAIPTPEGLTPVGQRALGLVVAGILTFSLQPVALPVAIPLFVLLAVPAGICKLPEAISSFMGPAFIFVFAMICLALAFEKSGLTRRIALMVVAHSGGSPKRLLFLFIATASLTSTVLADIPVLAMLFPICQKIIENNGCNVRGNKFAQSLLLGIGSGCFLGGMATPAGSAANPVSIQILREMTGISISFMEWAAIGFPVVLALIPVIWLCLVVLLPSEIKTLKGMDELRREKDALGPLSRNERIYLIVFAATLVMWLTDRINGIPVQVTSIASVAILSLPGIAIFDWKRDRSGVNWDAIMLTGGATAFGFFLVKGGVTNWFAQTYLTSFAALPVVPLFIAICAVMILSQFPLPASVGAVAAIAPAFLVIAQMKGLNPAGVMLVIALGSAGPILSPAVCFYPIINASGLLRVHDVWKVGFPTACGQLVCILIAVFVIGSALGFM